jgi:hypothetical protein
MPRAAQTAPHDEVFGRIRNGLNVKVADLAPLIGITEAGLYRAVREKRIEAVNIGRAVFIPARVAAPLVGIKSEPAAPIAA